MKQLLSTLAIAAFIAACAPTEPANSGTITITGIAPDTTGVITAQDTITIGYACEINTSNDSVIVGLIYHCDDISFLPRKALDTIAATATSGNVQFTFEQTAPGCSYDIDPINDRTIYLNHLELDLNADGDAARPRTAAFSYKMGNDNP